MNCRSARDAIREADVAELEAPGDTELGRHLAVCPDCRAAAAAVLDGTAALRAALDEMVASAPRRSVDSALAELRRPRTRLPSLPRPLPRLAPWAVAAAAVLAASLLTRTPPAPPAMDRPSLSLAAAAPPPVVEDAGGADIAVFDTRDPGITVVWIYQEDIR
jgi:anti-sigma factor RsiW